jgi:DNA-directed RNA polymerase specialized sigma subunit
LVRKERRNELGLFLYWCSGWCCVDDCFGCVAIRKEIGCDYVRKKSETQIYLEQPERLDSIIKNKLIEKQQWKEMALGITANMDGERVQSSGAKDKMASAVERCVDMEAEIDRLIDKLIDTKKEVIQTIEQLHSPIEYNVLHMRYIQYKSLQEIADHYGKDYGWVTTCHGRALKSVQEIRERK